MVLPDISALEARVNNVHPRDEMRSAVTAAMRIDDVASLELDGDFPTGGAEVSLTCEYQAVPADDISVIAHPNEVARKSEPLEATLSEDCRTRTASHFSVFAVIDAVRRAIERSDEPTGTYEPGNWLGFRTEGPTVPSTPRSGWARTRNRSMWTTQCSRASSPTRRIPRSCSCTLPTTTPTRP